MTGREAAKPKARSEGLVIERLGDEMLIYDLERDEAHNLNSVAAAVFVACDAETSVTGVAKRASERLGQEVTAKTAWQAVQELAEKHLLANEPVPVTAVSRRDVVRRVALAGVGVAGAATMIDSIVAPTSVHAQSPGDGACLQQGSSCSPGGTPCCSGLTCGAGLCAGVCCPPATATCTGSTCIF